MVDVACMTEIPSTDMWTVWERDLMKRTDFESRFKNEIKNRYFTDEEIEQITSDIPPKGLTLHMELLENIEEDYTFEEIGHLVVDCRDYMLHGVIPEYKDRGQKQLWKMAQGRIDYDQGEWSKRVIHNRIIASNKKLPPETAGKPLETNIVMDGVSVMDGVTVLDGVLDSENTPTPTPENIRAYFKAKDSKVNADKFYDHYGFEALSQMPDWRTKADQWTQTEYPKKESKHTDELETIIRQLQEEERNGTI